jgi:hypothetical protein
VNNKNVKYILIVAVVAVWATIIYRIVGHLSSGASSPRPPVAVSQNQLVMVSDTFTLNADYPDPFLEEADTTAGDTILNGKPAQARSAGDQLLPPMESPTSIIQLTGIIGNPQKKSRVAIIDLRGKEYLVREKEKIEGFYVEKITKNSIHILYKGEPYTIVK